MRDCIVHRHKFPHVLTAMLEPLCVLTRAAASVIACNFRFA